ncbi:MAG: PD-(D/E)XK nuclease family protein [Chloroflexota bacterium]|nr:PD-(D/E)XK nuclease family protein [Chloroflexota bacterium]
MNLSDDFAFTQGSLGDYADCARRFELRFIKRVRYPALEVQDALGFETRTRQGARFHKMVQQHLLGVPAEALAASLADDEELARWWANYLARGLTDLPTQRLSEITLQTHLAGRRLVAKYDLLALAPGGRAVIVDWKTGARAPSQSSLRGRMQTIVYRYVLAQAGAHLYAGERIPPERIRMDYVYVAAGGERVSFAYSAAQMREDEALLAEMIAAIDRAETFPLTDDARRCRFCSYRSLCDRGGAGRLEDFDIDEYEDEEEETFALDIDQIAEIEF